MSRFTAGILLFVLIFLVGCKDSTSPPVPTSITITAPWTAFEALGATLQLTAQITDQKGRPMTGITLAWSSSNEAVAQVSATSGQATAVGQGSVTISATAEGARGTISLTVTQVPTTLQKVRGDDQQGTVGQALPLEPRVRILDAGGRAIPGKTITFDVVLGGGSVSSITVTGNANGEASAAWTLGTDVSSGQRLTTSVDGLSADFTATALPGPMAELSLAGGDEQTGEAFGALGEPLAVTVLDEFGNPIPGVEIEWSAGTESGSLSPAKGTTDETGSSEAAWTLGPVVGNQTATAVVSNFASVPFSATSIAPPVAEVIITPANPFLELGGTIQLAAAALAAEGGRLQGVGFTWSSSDPSTVSVDQTGALSGIKAGQATISAEFGGATGNTTVAVPATAQQTGVRLEVLSPATAGQTVQAQLILNTTGISHAVGAVAVTIQWDPAVLTLGDWSAFTGAYWWDGVKWESTGTLKVVVSVPDGLTGEVTLLSIPLDVVGASGAQSNLALTVDRAISAFTFLEIRNDLPGLGTLIRVN